MEACQGKVDWSIRRKTTNHTGRQSSGGFLRRNDWFSVAVCVSGKMIWATKLKSHCQRLLHCYRVSDRSWRACIYLCTGGSSSNQSERAHPRHVQWIGASCVMCTVSDWVQSLVDCWTGSLEYLFTVAKFVTHTETIGIFFFNLATGSIEDCSMRTLHSCHVLFIMQNFTLWLSGVTCGVSLPSSWSPEKTSGLPLVLSELTAVWSNTLAQFSRNESLVSGHHLNARWANLSTKNWKCLFFQIFSLTSWCLPFSWKESISF